MTIMPPINYIVNMQPHTQIVDRSALSDCHAHAIWLVAGQQVEFVLAAFVKLPPPLSVNEYKFPVLVQMQQIAL